MATAIREIMTRDVRTCAANARVSEAAALMRDHDIGDVVVMGDLREHGVRRLPVVDGDKPVGIVSLGDLAMERDPKSALADISAKPGNL